MKLLLIIKDDLSLLNRSSISVAIKLKADRHIEHIHAICITESYQLQYALALGIDKGTHISTNCNKPFDLAKLIIPYTQSVDCILLNDTQSIYGKLGRILSGMLKWTYATYLPNNPSQHILSITDQPPQYPCINTLLKSTHYHKENLNIENSYSLQKQYRKQPLRRLFTNKDDFILELIKLGILQ